MSETLREMTYDEQIADFIIHILAIETPFSVKRDLISHLLSLTYRYERDIKDALYTPTPSCTFKAEEGRDMSRFPKDCWNKHCEHFHVTDMSIDDLLCACDVLGYECDACDEDYCHLRCPLAEKAKEGE